MLAFGGAGPLLGPIVAQDMEMLETIVPASPALFSAWGMLTTDLEYDVSRSLLVPLESAKNLEVVRELLAELDTETYAALDQRGDRQTSPIELHDEVEVRYQGQEFGLAVGLGPDDSLDALCTRSPNCTSVATDTAFPRTWR